MNLYDISSDILKLEELMASEDGSDEAMAEAMAEAMEGTKENLEEKVSGYVMLLRNWEASAGAIQLEEKRLAARRKIFENKGARLRDFLLMNLQRMDTPTLTLPIATVTRRQGSESVVVDDKLALPQGYYDTEIMVKVDKVALKKLWKETPEEARSDLPGFRVERGPESLQIK